MLEEIVAERKSVLGDDVLEITASDIKVASQRIRAVQPTIKRFQSTELVTRAYIVLGIGLMVGAYFYPQLKAIFAENRIQAYILIMGASMAAIGWLFSYWVSIRRKRICDDAEKYLTMARWRAHQAEEKA